MTAIQARKKLLFYIDPHPIRNSCSCFLNEEVKLLLKKLVAYLPIDYDLRIFSNEVTITTIQHVIPAVSPICLHPSASESEQIDAYFCQWDSAALKQRNELILGKGAITEFYFRVLERIHDEVYDFDSILAWSDNGAVKRFAHERGIVALFAELGPTRRPYCPTLYFDHEGTNGFASICRTNVEDLEPMAVVPRTIWSLSGDKRVYDEPLTLRPSSKNDKEKIIPQRPYVFVALQLADDLNTVLCSHYQSPADFLQRVIEDFQGTNYDIVVKGHPGAVIGAYNLKAQKEAAGLTKEYKHVYFLDNDLSMMETISWYVHASAVISINSSLTFEALLSGKKSYVAGDAVYNLSGLMNYTPERVLAGEAADGQLDRMTSFLCGHYFHPCQTVFETDLVYRLFDFYTEMKQKGILGTKEFWKQYADAFSDGFQALVPEEFRKEEDQTFELPMASILVHPSYRPKELRKSGGELAFCFSAHDGRDYIAHLHVADLFECRIEKAVEQGASIFITGWAFERGRKIPALQVLVFYDGTFLSRHRVVIARSDIRRKFHLSEMMDFGFQFECPNAGGDAGRYDILLLSESGRVQLVDIPDTKKSVDDEAKAVQNPGLMLVYGVGAHLKDMLKWHPELAAHVGRVFDKDSEKTGRLTPGIGIPIEHVSAIKNLPNGTEVAIAAIRYLDEITREIHALQPGVVCRNIDEVWMKYV